MINTTTAAAAPKKIHNLLLLLLWLSSFSYSFHPQQQPTTTMSSTTAYLPKRIIDAHHHFLDTRQDGNAKTFQAFLASLLADEQYLPEHYHKDVVLPLQEKGIALDSSVHVECMPNNGKKEAEWVVGLKSSSTVKAIVASADLASDSVEQELSQLAALPQVKGIRWILDCVGKFEPNTPTHVATKRHDGIDYLRGSHGVDTYDGDVVPAFEKGFALLAKHDLTFDLQCAPVQLPAAAALCQRHPQVKVVIDHLGKPRTLLGADEPSNTNITPDKDELERWRTGMKAVAAVPTVYVKLSMLGYAVPGWKKTKERRDLVKGLVKDVLEWFTPQRCMAALNWWKDGATSDSDFLSDVGPSPVEYVEFIAECLEGYSEADKERVFYGTAAEVYRIE